MHKHRLESIERVVINGSLGGYAYHTIKHGSQRSVLELILFNIFINDLDGWIDQVGMSMLEERIGI